MRWSRVTPALLAVLWIFSGAFASAQEGPAANAPSGDASFERTFTQWKDVLKQLRDLQSRFLIAEESELDAIRISFRAKLEESQLLINKMKVSGLQAYLKAPNSDPELTAFMIQLAKDDVTNDRYASARRITQTLLDNKCEEKVLYDLAGAAAFGTHDFDVAEEYLTKAEALEVLEAGADYRIVVSSVKEAWEKEQQIRAAEADDDLPRVKLQTNKGDIIVELFENEAPDTVGNFISLVEKGFYNGLPFHRVLSGFMAQGGCPNGDGTGGPGYRIYCECQNEIYRRHFAGSLSMAKEEPLHTGGSQFFLTFVPTPFLDGRHTVFGRIVEGMDVLANLQRRDPSKSSQLTITPDRIIKAEVLRKRPDHEYLPHKVNE